MSKEKTPTKEQMCVFVGKITESEYNELPALRCTYLKEFMKSPAHYKHIVSTPQKEETYFVIGDYVHTAILEPEKLASKFAVADVKSRNATEYKKVAAIAYGQGKRVLLKHEMEECDMMAANALADPYFRDLVGLGYPEITATAKLQDVWCKCRMDLYIPEEKHIVDVKTSAESAHWFPYNVRKFGYDIQAAFYRDIVQKASGEEINKVTFVLIEKKAPYAIRLFEITKRYMDDASLRYGGALTRYLECLSKNNWPSYDNSSPEILDLKGDVE